MICQCTSVAIVPTRDESSDKPYQALVPGGIISLRFKAVLESIGFSGVSHVERKVPDRIVQRCTTLYSTWLEIVLQPRFEHDTLTAKLVARNAYHVQTFMACPLYRPMCIAGAVGSKQTGH